MITDKITNYKRGNFTILGWLIIINVGVFLFVNVLMSVFFLSGGDSNKALEFLALPANFSDALFRRPWTFLTHMFLHAGFFHILFNMLWLYWMGKILLSYVGERIFLKFYLWGGICGAVLMLAVFEGLLPEHGAGIALGASGAVMAILAGTAVMAPNMVMHLFLLGPVKLKWIAIVMIIMSTVLDLSSNTGGKIAHMGGVIFGFLYANWLKSSGSFTASLSQPIFNKKRRIFSDEDYKSEKLTRKREIDILLEKISNRGYESLSKSEKDRLKKLSQQ